MYLIHFAANTAERGARNDALTIEKYSDNVLLHT
jgi:hypothetical protein